MKHGSGRLLLVHMLVLNPLHFHALFLLFARRGTQLTLYLDDTPLYTFTDVPTTPMYAMVGAAGGHGFTATTSYTLL